MPSNEYLIITFNKNSFHRIFIMSRLKKRIFH